MKITKIDNEDYNVFIEENGVEFPIYYANEYVLNFIRDYIEKHTAVIAAGLDFWRLEDNRDSFSLGYETILRKVDFTGKYPVNSIESLKIRVKEKYDFWIANGIEPQRQKFKIPLFSKRGIMEKYQIPPEVAEYDFYVFKLMDQVCEYKASQREKRDSGNRYDSDRRNL